jgi:hypothetical protein
MHGQGATPSQDPDQCLRRNISPLLSVCECIPRLFSAALSCPLSFFLNFPVVLPPSQSQPNPHPSITGLRRRPLHCGSVPRHCSRHTGIVLSSRHSPRDSAELHTWKSTYCLRSKHTLPIQPPADVLLYCFFLYQHCLLSVSICCHHNSSTNRHLPRSLLRLCLINNRDCDPHHFRSSASLLSTTLPYLYLL